MTIPLVIGVNPLQTTSFELGIVSGRVALLLRSAEIHPVFVRFVTALRGTPPPFLVMAPGRAGASCENVQVDNTCRGLRLKEQPVILITSYQALKYCVCFWGVLVVAVGNGR
jgi:hypothetical protein